MSKIRGASSQYYHGANSIYTNNDNLIICFHDHLTDFLTIEKFQDIKSFVPTKKLFEGKLYIGFDNNNNISFSVNDLKNNINDYIFFIPKQFDFSNTFKSEILELSNWIELKKSEELVRINNRKKIIILPGFPNSFILPLLLRFNYEIIKEDNLYYLLKFNCKDKTSISSEEINNIKVLGNEHKISNDILKYFKRDSEIPEKRFNEIKNNFV